MKQNFLKKKKKKLTAIPQHIHSTMSPYSKRMNFEYVFALMNIELYMMMDYINCRMEKVKIRTRLGMVKIVGLIVCMGGVATLAFYKGPQIWPLHNSNTHYSHHHQHHSSSSANPKTWYLGSLLLFFSIITWSIWLVLQVI